MALVVEWNQDVKKILQKHSWSLFGVIQNNYIDDSCMIITFLTWDWIWLINSEHINQLS